MGEIEKMTSTLESDLEGMSEYFRSGRTKDVKWRQTQLKGLLLFLEENQREIFKALKEDLGKHHVEAYRDEIGTLIKTINFALRGLKKWMSSEKAKLPWFALLSSAELVPEPLGLVLVISSWNFPFGLSLEPLVGAIAAGNAVVLKPSEMSPSCSSVLANLMPTYLDSNAIKVFEGAANVGQQLLLHKWDKIFFTGSAKIGQIVMSAAAKHLTPVVLELGGKCPSVVDSLSSSWDKQAAVNRILVSKFGACAGQACITIDYLLVERRFAATLVELMKVGIEKMFGENPRESNSVARIVNQEHFSRLSNLLSDPAVRASMIVYGGSMDAKELFIEPTILLNPPQDAAIMAEEIFGPLLPIITVEKIEDSIQFINSKSKPLAIYAFTNDEKFKKRLISETSSGSLVFNDAVLQYAADTLPFGGVGESGTGRYHGKFSFETFSHYKAVVRRSFLIDFWFRAPPWNSYKFSMFETLYHLNYIGVLLVILGLKRSNPDI